MINATAIADHELVREAVREVASLTRQDLLFIIEVARQLKQKPSTTNLDRKQLIAELMNESRQLADVRKNVPRHQLAEEMKELIEQIRAQAIAKGTAIEDEWEGD